VANKREDQKFDTELEELQKKGFEGVLLRQEFRESLYEEFQDVIEEQRIENGGIESEWLEDSIMPSSDGARISGAVEERDEEGRGSTPSEEVSPSKTEILQGSSLNDKGAVESVSRDEAAAFQEVVSLEIVTTHTLRGVVEGERIFFKAIAIMGNGARREVTNEVSWRVVGPIGTMVKPGVFVTALDESVAEFGIGTGSVVAVWKDSLSRKEVFGKTPIFTVDPKVELLPDGSAG